jgi:protein-disulfide isomerase
MFARQPEWANHHAPKPEMVPGFARELGLDMPKFEASAGKEEHRAKVMRDKSDGEALGVRGTPTFFVNGRELEQLGYEPLKNLIEEELAKSGKAKN